MHRLPEISARHRGQLSRILAHFSQKPEWPHGFSCIVASKSTQIEHALVAPRREKSNVGLRSEDTSTLPFTSQISDSTPQVSRFLTAAASTIKEMQTRNGEVSRRLILLTYGAPPKLDVSREYPHVVYTQLRTIIETFEFTIHGRINELVKAEVEAAVLIGHERRGREES